MFDKKKYDSEYVRENYHRVSLLLPKEYKELLTDATMESGMSKNAFVKEAIDQKLKELGIL